MQSCALKRLVTNLAFLLSVMSICGIACLQTANAASNQDTKEQAPVTSIASGLPRFIRYTGVVREMAEKPRTGVVGVIFSIYDKEDAVAPVWLESQSVTADETGHYTVVLGATKADGLPANIFTSGEAR